MLRQVAVVQAQVPADLPVFGVLCFIEADWPLVGGAFTTPAVKVLWPKKLYPKLAANGPLGGPAIDQLHRQLAVALPAA